MRYIWYFLLMLIGAQTLAQSSDLTHDQHLRIDIVIDDYILPKYQKLYQAAKDIEKAGENSCVDNRKLRHHFNIVFDAWVDVSHLRFGPSEEKNRAFALAFWPDNRGRSSKTLNKILTEEDESILTLEAYQQISVAARGLYALELLLFDDILSQSAKTDYGCKLIEVMTKDIADNAGAVLGDWQNGYADLLRLNGRQDPVTALQPLLTALRTGFDMTIDFRLKRPLGSIERPRPKRAETWRSKRSMRHILLSLRSIKELSQIISQSLRSFEENFDHLETSLLALHSKDLSLVSDQNGRFKVEAITADIESLKEKILNSLEQEFGLSAGFTSLDGD